MSAAACIRHHTPCSAIGLCGYVGNTISGRKATGYAMFLLAPLHLLIALIPAAIGLLILYWVVRLAVRHGIRDTKK